MRGLIWRWISNALALMLIAWLFRGIVIESFEAALVASLVLGIVNAVIRPLLVLITLPLNIITLGLFTLVINGIMLSIVARVVEGFAVHGFFTAVFGALLLSFFSSLFSKIIED